MASHPNGLSIESTFLHFNKDQWRYVSRGRGQIKLYQIYLDDWNDIPDIPDKIKNGLLLLLTGLKSFIFSINVQKYFQRVEIFFIYFFSSVTGRK